MSHLTLILDVEAFKTPLLVAISQLSWMKMVIQGESIFNLCAFLLALLVVILVRIYGLAGKVKAKAVEGPTPVLEAKGGKLSISNREGSPWLAEIN